MLADLAAIRGVSLFRNEGTAIKVAPSTPKKRRENERHTKTNKKLKKSEVKEKWHTRETARRNRVEKDVTRQRQRERKRNADVERRAEAANGIIER